MRSAGASSGGWARRRVANHAPDGMPPECLSNSPQTPPGHLAGADDCAVNPRKLPALSPKATEEEQCDEEKCARQQEWLQRCCLLERFIPKAKVRTRCSQNRPKPVLKQPNSKSSQRDLD